MPTDTHPEEGYVLRTGELNRALGHGKYWRWSLWGALGLLGVSISGNIVQSFLPKWTPKYIEINTCATDASVRVVGDAPLTYTRRHVTIAGEVRRFVRDLRRISTDIEITKEGWRSLEFRVTPEGKKALAREQDQLKPLTKRGAVWVQVVRAVPRAGTTMTYDVRWEETSYNDKKELIGVATYSGLFTFVIRDPVTLDELSEEGAGVFLEEWHYGKEGGGQS